MGNQKDRVRLNVGGKIYETTAATLAKAGRNSLLGAMFDDNWNLRSDTTTTEHFIDRDPDYFSVLLNLLRTGELYIPSNLSEKLLYQEALFYGLLDHVKSAKWGPFDGNCLGLSQSVTGRAAGLGMAIRAGPDGGCCVAHENIVRVYDWMMKEHSPINLNYNKINNAGWIDPDKIVITTSEGMGLFSSSNGELRHKFDVEHNYAGGLSFSSDYKIFSSCRGKCDSEYGVGVWDQKTGKQVDFFCGLDRFYANKLQWLHSTNCLLMTTDQCDYSSISLLDFRVKKVVMCLCDRQVRSNWERSWDERQVRDTIAMEGTNLVCVINEYEDLGFIDLRKENGNVMWISKRRVIARQPRYPKLGFHEGQLFTSINDCLSVFCGPDWALSSTLQRSKGGFIRDFSIGGDRLFALHHEKNVFDIWDTPLPPVI